MEDDEISDRHDVALDEALASLRARRKVIEMTPYGPVLDAPAISGRAYYEAVINDPSSSISARRQAREWLRSHPTKIGVKGSKHYMVRRKRKREKQRAHYWRNYAAICMRKFRDKHRSQPIELVKEEVMAMVSFGRKLFGERAYTFIRKDESLPWRWDNISVASKSIRIAQTWAEGNRNKVKIVDILTELARPAVP